MGSWKRTAIGCQIFANPLKRRGTGKSLAISQERNMALMMLARADNCPRAGSYASSLMIEPYSCVTLWHGLRDRFFAPTMNWPGRRLAMAASPAPIMAQNFDCDGAVLALTCV